MQLREFELIRSVGRGGMGEVFEAYQRSLNRPVALKLLHRELLGSLHVVRFQREARAIGRLHHSHVVGVFGAGEVNGQPYLAMEFVDGSSLDGVIAELRRADEALCQDGVRTDRTTDFQSVAEHRRTGSPPYEADSGNTQTDEDAWQAGSLPHYRFAARVGAEVAEALDYANRQGVLHRDVKPSNVLIDQSGSALLSDFGLARLVDERDNLTLTGQVVGTLRYLAPEALERDSDHRSDIYCLGATLYELVTLRSAYDESDRSRLLHQLANTDPLPPRRVDSRVPDDLDAVISKAMAREPHRRYESAGQMRLTSGGFLTGGRSRRDASRSSNGLPCLLGGIRSLPSCPSVWPR